MAYAPVVDPGKICSGLHASKSGYTPAVKLSMLEVLRSSNSRRVKHPGNRGVSAAALAKELTHASNMRRTKTAGPVARRAAAQQITPSPSRTTLLKKLRSKQRGK